MCMYIRIFGRRLNGFPQNPLTKLGELQTRLNMGSKMMVITAMTIVKTYSTIPPCSDTVLGASYTQTRLLPQQPFQAGTTYCRYHALPA